MERYFRSVRVGKEARRIEDWRKKAFLEQMPKWMLKIEVRLNLACGMTQIFEPSLASQPPELQEGNQLPSDNTANFYSNIYTGF